jgi:adenylate cyclase
MPEKILFVDDEPDFERLIRQKYRRMLRQGAIDLDFARNGKEALHKLDAKDDFALVMTDINMPEMDGLRLLEEINKRDEDCLVVIISAYGDMENIRTAMNRGAFDFLTKPINFEDMEITRQKALDEVLKVRERLRLQAEKLELEERNRFIQDTFGRYLNDAVVQTLLDSPDGLELGGEKRNVTILMSDLRGFSVLAERYPPEEIVATLNHYLSTMIDVIMEYGGIIDELIGDAILAIFGAPLLREDDAERAVACAAAMQLAMESVNEHNARRGWPILDMGIGIDSGEVVVGNIGSKKRAKYGIVGKHVNLAARIEACTVGGQVMLSENTLDQCGPILEVGKAIEFIAKGFAEPIKLYELRGVGGIYNLRLPERTIDLIELDESLPMRYSPLGTGMSKEIFHDGYFLKIAARGCELQASHALELLKMVKIRILDDDGNAPFSDLYAKVIEQVPDAENRFVVCFTSVPPEVDGFVKATVKRGGSIH